MDASSGNTTSLWHDTVGSLARSSLTDDARADVCVVGAGIAGMMTAYLLAREGQNVIVLDDGPIGGGETGRTTAHLSDALDDRYTRLESVHGRDGAVEAAASHRAAIELIASIVDKEAIDCDFAWVDGYLFAAVETSSPVGTSSPVDATQATSQQTAGIEDLRRELEAARRAGVTVSETTAPPYSPFADGSQGVTALRFERQARVNALKLLDGLARCIERDGGRIHTGTHVTGVDGGAPVRITTSNGPAVLASACVVATNSPISDFAITHAKQAPYRTFAVAVRVPAGAVPDALYWDDADPYTYIRLQPGEGHDWLIVGGADHKVGQEEDGEARLDRLVAWTKARFPVDDVGYRWSGQVLEPADGLAFIGRNPDGADNVFIATGDSGHGMTHGAIAGMLLTDLIAGRESRWTALYDPKRISARAAGEVAKENLNVIAQFRDWVSPGDVSSADDVPPGTGRIVRRGVHLVAVYRDENGTVTERSAACTHMKCAVRWNSLEKSWDCPCHGSRFAPTGEVLNGPAVEGLGEVDGGDTNGTNGGKRETKA